MPQREAQIQPSDAVREQQKELQNGIDYQRLESSFGSNEIPVNLISGQELPNGTRVDEFNPIKVFRQREDSTYPQILQGAKNENIGIISESGTQLDYRDARNALRFEQAFNGKHPGGIVVNKDGKSAIGFVPYTDKGLVEMLESTNYATKEYENVLVKKEAVYIKPPKLDKDGNPVVTKDAQGYTKQENTLYKYESNQLEHRRKELVGKRNAQGELVEPTEADCKQKLNESLKTLVAEFHARKTDGSSSETAVTVARGDVVKKGFIAKIHPEGVVELTSIDFKDNKPPRRVLLGLQKSKNGELVPDVSKVFVEVGGKRFAVDENDFAFFSQFFVETAPQTTSWEQRKVALDEQTKMDREIAQNRLDEILNADEFTEFKKISDLELVRGEIYKRMKEVEADQVLRRKYEHLLNVFNEALNVRGSATTLDEALGVIKNPSNEFVKTKGEIFSLKVRNLQALKQERQKSEETQLSEKRANQIAPFYIKTKEELKATVLGEPTTAVENYEKYVYLVPDVPIKESYSEEEKGTILAGLGKKFLEKYSEDNIDNFNNKTGDEKSAIITKSVETMLTDLISDLNKTIDSETEDRKKIYLQMELALKQQLLERILRERRQAEQAKRQAQQSQQQGNRRN